MVVEQQQQLTREFFLCYFAEILIKFSRKEFALNVKRQAGREGRRGDKLEVTTKGPQGDIYCGDVQGLLSMLY